jgi:hypothetical protein
MSDYSVRCLRCGHEERVEDVASPEGAKSRFLEFHDTCNDGVSQPSWDNLAVEAVVPPVETT